MIIYPTSQRLLINMCGYDNNKDWANYLEDAIKEATQVIWGDYSIALKNLESLLLIIKEMDAVEFRDYIHRINKYLQIYDDLSVNKSTKTLTAQDISDYLFQKNY